MLAARNLFAVALAAALGGVAVPTASAQADRAAWPGGIAVVGYRSEAGLRGALAASRASVVRRIPSLRVAEVRPRASLAAFAAAVGRRPGVRWVERRRPRTEQVEPALAPTAASNVPYEWQWAATREDLVPESVRQAATSITIAVVDTGADVTVPDLAAKAPETHSVLSDSTDVTDRNGHGTFVSALAAGSPSNGEGIAGAGGEARLLVVQASSVDGSFTDVDEAAAIVYAVDHGARIVNLSLGGPETSSTERSAIDYAAAHGVLLVAAAGNSGDSGSAAQYPAALVQPIGSNGQGGVGLAVGASTERGARAAFSNAGSYLSLAAPGENVFSAVSSSSDAQAYPRSSLPGSSSGLYGFGSGTSFASPQVAGAAALVWAANPALGAQEVADILEQTASGRGAWTPELGYGVVDVAAAVARATGAAPAPQTVELTGRRVGRLAELEWSSRGAAAFRVAVSRDGAPARVVLRSTTRARGSFRLAPGHSYAFTAAALDAAGAELGVAGPLVMSLPRAPVSVALHASRSRARGPAAVRFTAEVRAEIGVSASARPVVLESWQRGRWRRAASGSTARDGRATWTVRLRAGSHRLRARLVATDGLPAESSPAISVVIN